MLKQEQFYNSRQPVSFVELLRYLTLHLSMTFQVAKKLLENSLILRYYYLIG